MNKEEFLKRLEQLLSDISEEERADALAFYRSYFEDAGIGNEASILEELESPEKVAEVIKKDLGVSEAADVETHEADVRGEKVEAHTEETSGNGQKTETGTDDPYMNSLYGSSTYGSGNYEQKNTAYTGGTYGSQNTSGQIDIENLKKEINLLASDMEKQDAAEFYSELADWAYANGEAMLMEDEPEMQDYENQ